jgi:endoglucanase
MKRDVLKMVTLILSLMIVGITFLNSKTAAKLETAIDLESDAIIRKKPVEYFGPLKIVGSKIVGNGDKPVQLRGMSFFWSQWMGKYYTDSCVKWLKSDWNCNIVRAAMGVEEGGYLANPEVEKRKVFEVVDAAIKHGLYVIIDWHDHHATDHLKEAKSFFGEMAKKYGHRPNIIYETFNEPLQISWGSMIKPYHQAVIDTIRHYDPDNLIICGTPTWSQDVDIAANDPLVGTNIGYTLHFYPGTHKQALRDKARIALGKNVALMVTEFGTTEATGDGRVEILETQTWWKFLDDNQISWCNWSVADKVESSASLKPGASALGGWATSQLTESGLFVRAEMKSKNQKFK